MNIGFLFLASVTAFGGAPTTVRPQWLSPGVRSWSPTNAAPCYAKSLVLGAKWVPRALAEYGYIDDAWQIFVQENGCGYMKWLQKGEDTLWESWHGKDSHNHIMYGDFSSWAFEYVGGIRLLEPGFGRIALKPHLPAGVKDFEVRHETPRGTVVVALKREADGEVTVKTNIPAGILD